MFWFYVTQNVVKHLHDERLDVVSKHCWQAFRTPPGYAAANNPLETYHYTLKLVNDSKRATPTELVTRLDLSRIAYVASMTPFIDEPQNRDLVLVRVSPSTRIPATTEDALEPSPSNNTSTQLSDVRRSYEAANYSRLIWVDQTIRRVALSRWQMNISDISVDQEDDECFQSVLILAETAFCCGFNSVAVSVRLLHVLDNTEMAILCSATSCQQRQQCSCQGNNIQRASLCARNLGVMKMTQSSPAFSTYFDL
ncbi:hypothetical protein GQ600_20225 [Phytophthora cactorum]|nr:hypothetical protein GQ600_20225 [Phytophthora cactorum]